MTIIVCAICLTRLGIKYKWWPNSNKFHVNDGTKTLLYSLKKKTISQLWKFIKNLKYMVYQLKVNLFSLESQKLIGTKNSNKKVFKFQNFK